LNSRAFVSFFLSIALLLGACSKPVEPVRIEGEGKPALWKVQGKTGTTWLFGTVHLLPSDTDWQTAAFHDAVRQADSLLLEASGLDDQKAVAEIFASMGVSGGQPKLTSRTDAALHPVIDRLDSDIPGPRAVLDHMESWAAALTLASVQSADLGLNQNSGVERVLTLRFRAEDKAISGLETISQQFGFFDLLSEKDQRLMLDRVLRNSDKNRPQFEKMLAAWMRGDPDAVIADLNDGILASPAIREALLDGRNRNWAAQIAKRVDNNDNVFVAVGAAHMAGKGGVPALLGDMGYAVERVQ
jgi:uncharacterized protein YbaP (TraB family)